MGKREAFVHVDIYDFVRVVSEDSIKHGGVVLKDTVKLFLLVNDEMCTFVGNCMYVSRTIIRSQDARF